MATPLTIGPSKLRQSAHRRHVGLDSVGHRHAGAHVAANDYGGGYGLLLGNARQLCQLLRFVLHFSSPSGGDLMENNLHLSVYSSQHQKV